MTPAYLIPHTASNEARGVVIPLGVASPPPPPSPLPCGNTACLGLRSTPLVCSRGTTTQPAGRNPRVDITVSLSNAGVSPQSLLIGLLLGCAISICIIIVVRYIYFQYCNLLVVGVFVHPFSFKLLRKSQKRGHVCHLL